ncbi:MAG: CRISPR-associated endoribonuclease Cas6 [Bacteroidota bacterium]|jgi:CRISPR-associated endoribonuclease Cas6
MELIITFQNTKPGIAIPMDYQYFLSSWMYNVMSKGDSAYAKFLHDTGYKLEDYHKVFKLFCFSNLYIQDFRYDTEKKIFYINGPLLRMKARFKVDKAIETFIQGLFNGQVLTLKNGFNSMARFDVVNVEVKQVAIHDETVSFHTLSPLVIGRKNSKGNDDYLSPLDPDFEQLFFINLIDKYLASGGVMKPEWTNATQKINIKNPQNVKSKLITIKDGEKAETKVRGFNFSFELTAPKELIEIGLMGGFGKENGMGFGFGEVAGVRDE